MPSTATSRNRFEKQGSGENANTWGTKLNTTGLDLIDEALDGRAAFTLSGSKTLTSTNYASDEARKRVLDITGGTGGTITLPAVEKLYFARNNSTGSVIFTTGGGDEATLASGLTCWISCDGTNVYADGSAADAFEFAQQAEASATAAAADADSAAANQAIAETHAEEAAASAASAALFDADTAYFYAVTF